MSRAVPADPETMAIFESVARKVRRTNKHVIVEYYPYSSVKNVARDRDGYVHVRLSDTLAEAPAEVKEAIAYVLLYRGRSMDLSGCRRLYQDYIYSDEAMAREKVVLRGRGKGAHDRTTGRHYDLAERFDLMNKRYFGGEVERPALAWSVKPSRWTWGSHDAFRRLILINSRLDDEKVPVFVLDYVLYHEMLHVRHEARPVGGRRRPHSRDFKDEETAFPQYKEAEAWLQRLSRRRR